MARSRDGLAEAVTAVLTQNGENGKRMSLRQAERLTGLSPATIGELAKGNARTPETIRRFAQGFGQDIQRLLLLAGFVPEDMIPTMNEPGGDTAAVLKQVARPEPEREPTAQAASGRYGPRPHYGTGRGRGSEMETDEGEWLGRFGRALAKMPPGRERELFKDRLRQDTELIETFLARLSPDDNAADGQDDGRDGAESAHHREAGKEVGNGHR